MLMPLGFQSQLSRFEVFENDGIVFKHSPVEIDLLGSRKNQFFSAIKESFCIDIVPVGILFLLKFYVVVLIIIVIRKGNCERRMTAELKMHRPLIFIDHLIRYGEGVVL